MILNQNPRKRVSLSEHIRVISIEEYMSFIGLDPKNERDKDLIEEFEELVTLADWAVDDFSAFRALLDKYNERAEDLYKISKGYIGWSYFDKYLGEPK